MATGTAWQWTSIHTSKFDVITMAYPTNRCPDQGWCDDRILENEGFPVNACEFCERVRTFDGKVFDVYYIFQPEDQVDEDNNCLLEEDFPWDEAHCDRINEIVGEGE